MRLPRRSGPVRTILALAIWLTAVVVAAPEARAADEADIVGLKATEAGLEVTVAVPRGSKVDLAGVTATLNEQAYPVSAQRLSGGTATASQRTAILAIDTSRSMLQGTRIEDAKEAAKIFLDNVPADVLVGIVGFSSEVETVLEPTTDRGQAAALIDGLELTLQTRLFDGVVAAIDLAGDEGTRSVLVLSDGEDTTSAATIQDVEAAVSGSEVTVDVVALEQGPAASGVLARIVSARGTLIDSTSEDLAADFEAEAQDLGRQVAVTITAEDDDLQGQVSVQVTLPVDGGELTGMALYSGEAAGPAEVPTEVPPVVDDTSLPAWVMYTAVALVFAALLVGLVTLVPAGRVAARSPQARISTYTAGLVPGAGGPKQDEPALTQATDAIAGVLRRNQGLDERISARLLAAGSALRSSEWLLLHAAIALGAFVVGLLLGRGALILGLLFLVLGLVLPWVYLGLRRNRRRRKFESSLPETLQLMSGSLSAGLSMLQAIDTIVREGADPVASEFRRVLVEIRLGVALDVALEGVADRFDSRDFRWVVMAIRIQRQVGGNLAELLTTVSATIREREYIRHQVAALAAEGKLSAYVLGGLPPAFLLYLVVAQPSYVEPLFTDLRGLIMLVGGALWLGVGIVWMSRLIRVEV